MIWSDIEGWFSEEDAQFVVNICSKIENGVVVELGVFAGRSTAIMAPICLGRDTQYYAVDNFRGSDNLRDEATIIQRNRNIKELFESNMKEMGILSAIRVIQSNSSESSSLFNDGVVDFCFIDADHAPVAVQRDIDAWWPKIKTNGFIGGHDYPSPLRSVVDQFAQNNQARLITSGRCWGIQKGGNK
jgi:predicted O-methyltransferase YrrM